MYYYLADSDLSESTILCKSSTVSSLLTMALFCTSFALAPNLKVPIVSSLLVIQGEHVMMKLVFELPPSECVSNLVSYEFL
jgi:hypothetical protein